MRKSLAVITDGVCSNIAVFRFHGCTKNSLALKIKSDIPGAPALGGILDEGV